jgi:hypothetical protein
MEQRMVVISWPTGVYIVAKEMLTSISREYGIKVIFFDGRGGPPSAAAVRHINFMLPSA